MDGVEKVLLVVVVALGLIFVLGIVLIAWVTWRYRLPPRGVFAMGATLIYLVSPIDVLPESLLGPFGLIDDAGIVAITAIWVYKLVKARQMLIEAGVLPRRPNSPDPEAAPAAGSRRRIGR